MKTASATKAKGEKIAEKKMTKQEWELAAAGALGETVWEWVSNMGPQERAEFVRAFNADSDVKMGLSETLSGGGVFTIGRAQ